MIFKQYPKTYCKIVKKLANKTKIALIYSLLEENQLVTNLLVNSKLFKSYFSQKRTTIDNDSSIQPAIKIQTDGSYVQLGGVSFAITIYKL